MRALRNPRGLVNRVFCLILFANTANAQVSASDPLTFHAQEAARAAATRDWPVAEQRYRAVLQLEPNISEAHSNLALACYFQKKYSDAEHEFREALRLQPDLFVPNLFLGRYYFDRGDFARAVPFLQEGTRLQPKETQLRRLLAAAFVGAGNHLAAVPELKQNLALDPGDIESLYSLAKIYMHLAQQWAERANAHPTSGRLYHNLILARRFQLEGKWSTARKYYQAASDTKSGLTRIAVSVALGHIALVAREYDTP